MTGEKSKSTIPKNSNSTNDDSKPAKQHSTASTASSASNINSRMPHMVTRLPISDLNQHLTCALCSGYMIDATTVVECLHSFCRSCLLRYLETSTTCPICDTQINKAQLDKCVRADHTLQDLVYKLVPGLYKSELRRRKDFYLEQCKSASSAENDMAEASSSNASAAAANSGMQIFDKHLVELSAFICTPDEIISFSLESAPSSATAKRIIDVPAAPVVQTTGKASSGGNVSQNQHPVVVESNNNNNSIKNNNSDGQQQKTAVVGKKTENHMEHFKRYFRCPAAVTVGHLKKLMACKLDLTSSHQVEILHSDEPLLDEYTLMDIAYIYTWRRKAPMRLFFNICKYENEEETMPLLMPEVLAAAAPSTSAQQTPMIAAATAPTTSAGNGAIAITITSSTTSNPITTTVSITAATTTNTTSAFTTVTTSTGPLDVNWDVTTTASILQKFDSNNGVSSRKKKCAKSQSNNPNGGSSRSKKRSAGAITDLPVLPAPSSTTKSIKSKSSSSSMSNNKILGDFPIPQRILPPPPPLVSNEDLIKSSGSQLQSNNNSSNTNTNTNTNDNDLSSASIRDVLKLAYRPTNQLTTPNTTMRGKPPLLLPVAHHHHLSAITSSSSSSNNNGLQQQHKPTPITITNGAAASGKLLGMPPIRLAANLSGPTGSTTPKTTTNTNRKRKAKTNNTEPSFVIGGAAETTPQKQPKPKQPRKNNSNNNTNTKKATTAAPKAPSGFVSSTPGSTALAASMTAPPSVLAALKKFTSIRPPDKSLPMMILPGSDKPILNNYILSVNTNTAANTSAASTILNNNNNNKNKNIIVGDGGSDGNQGNNNHHRGSPEDSSTEDSSSSPLSSPLGSSSGGSSSAYKPTLAQSACTQPAKLRLKKSLSSVVQELSCNAASTSLVGVAGPNANVNGCSPPLTLKKAKLMNDDSDTAAIVGVLEEAGALPEEELEEKQPKEDSCGLDVDSNGASTSETAAAIVH